MSFFVDKIVPGGLTLNDGPLIPSYSEALPRRCGFTYRFTCCVWFNSPFERTTSRSKSPNNNSR